MSERGEQSGSKALNCVRSTCSDHTLPRHLSPSYPVTTSFRSSPRVHLLSFRSSPVHDGHLRALRLVYHGSSLSRRHFSVHTALDGSQQPWLKCRVPFKTVPSTATTHLPQQSPSRDGIHHLVASFLDGVVATVPPSAQPLDAQGAVARARKPRQLCTTISSSRLHPSNPCCRPMAALDDPTTTGSRTNQLIPRGSSAARDGRHSKHDRQRRSQVFLGTERVGSIGTGVEKVEYRLARFDLAPRASSCQASTSWSAERRTTGLSLGLVRSTKNLGRVRDALRQGTSHVFASSASPHCPLRCCRRVQTVVPLGCLNLSRSIASGSRSQVRMDHVADQLH